MRFKFESFGILLRYSLHGGALKGLALICRGLFFVVLVPKLLDGELASYVYINSISVGLAMLAVVGLNDELPRQIAGDANKARGYLKWFYLLNSVAIGLAVFAIFYSSYIVAIALFTIVVAAGRLLGGIIRSVNVRLFETVQNIPWVLFVIAALVIQCDTGVELIILMSMSMALVQLLAALLIRSSSGSEAAHEPFAALVKIAVSHGFTKLISNLFMLGFVRGAILWPVWLSHKYGTDEIAFAVAIGSVITEFGAIPVNRIYAMWCVSTPKHVAEWKKTVLLGCASAFLLSAATLFLLMVTLIFNWLPPQVTEPWLLAQSLVFYSLVPSFLLIQYLLWSRGIFVLRIIFAKSIMFLGLALIVYWFEPVYWFLLCSGLIVCASIYLLAVSRSSFPAQRS